MYYSVTNLLQYDSCISLYPLCDFLPGLDCSQLPVLLVWQVKIIPTFSHSNKLLGCCMVFRFIYVILAQKQKMCHYPAMLCMVNMNVSIIHEQTLIDRFSIFLGLKCVAFELLNINQAVISDVCLILSKGRKTLISSCSAIRGMASTWVIQSNRVQFHLVQYILYIYTILFN